MIFRADRRGFSLLELLLTLLLIGVIALVAVPGFLRYARHAALAAGANQMAMDMMKVRYLAVSKNCRVPPPVLSARPRLALGGGPERQRPPGSARGRSRRSSTCPPASGTIATGSSARRRSPSRPPSSPITFPGRVMSVGPTGRWSGHRHDLPGQRPRRACRHLRQHRRPGQSLVLGGGRPALALTIPGRVPGGLKTETLVTAGRLDPVTSVVGNPPERSPAISRR